MDGGLNVMALFVGIIAGSTILQAWLLLRIFRVLGMIEANLWKQTDIMSNSVSRNIETMRRLERELGQMPDSPFLRSPPIN